MAKLKEILETVSQRVTGERSRMIHLFQEGTFLRAYEWSAWLCVRYIQDFKATKRMFKNEDASVVFVGFPVSSLTRYTPEGAEVTVTEDKGVAMLLSEGVFQGMTDVDRLRADFENWKESVPLTESSKRDAKIPIGGDVSVSHSGRLTDIVYRILAYPIEQKSPLESMQFLAEIKRSIAEII